MTTIREIRSKIVEKLQSGEDTTSLEKELQRARIAEQRQIEVESLKAVAARRQAYQREADELREKLRRQEEAVDKFLKAAAELNREIGKLVPKAKALEQLGDANVSFHWERRFQRATEALPAQYWNGEPCYFLSHDKYSVEEVFELLRRGLGMALGALSGCRKREVRPATQSPEPDIG